MTEPQDITDTYPKPKEIWKHFKGNYYVIVDVSTLYVTDNKQERLVRYRVIDQMIFARSLEDFIGNVVGHESGYAGPRFVKVTELVCTICGCEAEYCSDDDVWRHKGDPSDKQYMMQTFCDKYGYPIPVRPAEVCWKPGTLLHEDYH